MGSPRDREPPTGTAAWFRNKTDAELEDVLRGGGVGNKHVDGALAEINRRSSARLETLAKWTLLFAGLAAVAGITALVR